MQRSRAGLVRTRRFPVQARRAQAWVLIFGVLFGLGGCAQHTFTGTVFDEVDAAAPIRGMNYDGTPFDLADLKGEGTLIFFGYTFCPDVCPLTLAELAAAKRILAVDTPKQAEQLQVVFVSVDPQRDNLDRLGAYIQAFDPDFYSVRVSEEDLATMKPAYGLYSEMTEEQSRSDESYLVDHTSGIYFIDRDGNWRALFRADVSAADLAADLRVLLR